MKSSPRSTANGSSPTWLRAIADGVAEPERLALAHVVDVGQLGDAAHLGRARVLPVLRQVVLELERRGRSGPRAVRLPRPVTIRMS